MRIVDDNDDVDDEDTGKNKLFLLLYPIDGASRKSYRLTDFH